MENCAQALAALREGVCDKIFRDCLFPVTLPPPICRRAMEDAALNIERYSSITHPLRSPKGWLAQPRGKRDPTAAFRGAIGLV